LKRAETRSKLINGTIHVIATDGLDKTTTKQISLATDTNEAYIYRCFADKEDMLSSTFAALDKELVDKVMLHVDIMYMHNVDMEMRSRLFFSAVWDFLLGNREKCLAYVRYFYSPYFKRYSIENHKERFKPVVEKFKSAFRDEADVWMILNHILNVMLDFAIKVYNGEMPDNDDYTEHIFRVIYVSVKQYFKSSNEGR